jgi:hypothetical protein
MVRVRGMVRVRFGLWFGLALVSTLAAAFALALALAVALALALAVALALAGNLWRISQLSGVPLSDRYHRKSCPIAEGEFGGMGLEGYGARVYTIGYSRQYHWFPRLLA